MKRAVALRFAAVVLGTFAITAVTACGKSNVTSPTSPSAPSTSAPASGSAVISGSVSVASFSAAGLQVAVSGYGLSGQVGASGQFQISQVPAGNLSLQFTGPNVNATVPIGQVAEREHVEVEIHLSSSNSGEVESSEHVSPDNRSEIEGRISSIDSSSRSLQVGARNVSAASARITSKGTALDFSALKVQQQVHVKGSVQGNSVNAEEIEIEDAIENQPQESEFVGSISALGGSCPGLSMTIAGKAVATDESTEFDKAACGDLKVGMSVDVKGSVQSNGSILASRIQAEDGPAGQPENEIEFTGSVASLGGSCPALTLGVAGKTVKTSGSTLFDRISCDAVGLGAGIEVKGIQQSDGSVAASRIRPQ